MAYVERASCCPGNSCWLTDLTLAPLVGVVQTASNCWANLRGIESVFIVKHYSAHFADTCLNRISCISFFLFKEVHHQGGLPAEAKLVLSTVAQTILSLETEFFVLCQARKGKFSKKEVIDMNITPKFPNEYCSFFNFHFTLFPSRCVDNKLGQNTVNHSPSTRSSVWPWPNETWC